ncbi:MAG: cell division protein SepF [Turicibacter sp.]|nr:cell division protein SepF [Turicibacter sp.]
MSLKDKFKSLVGMDFDEEEEYEQFELEEDFEEPVIEPIVAKPIEPKPVLRSIPNPQPAAAPVKPTKDMGNFTTVSSQQKGAATPMPTQQETSLQLDMMQMNKVIIREPNEYSDAQGIADCLKDNFPVFINLQRLEKAQAKRVVDFLSGTIYAIDGDIKRVGTNLFLCTPRTVETEGQVSLQELQLDAVE